MWIASPLEDSVVDENNKIRHSNDRPWLQFRPEHDFASASFPGHQATQLMQDARRVARVDGTAIIIPSSTAPNTNPLTKSANGADRLRTTSPTSYLSRLRLELGTQNLYVQRSREMVPSQSFVGHPVEPTVLDQKHPKQGDYQENSQVYL